MLTIGIFGGTRTAQGQALPTASEGSSLSVFAGAAGVYTGVGGGRNLGITAGGDYTIRGFFGFRPAIEVRGTYPIHDGTIADEKSILGGVRVERPIGRLHPYGDFLIGRGSINYIRTFTSADGYSIYLRTDSTVYDLGAGFEYDLSHHIALRADGQYQHWDTPAINSGTAWAKQGTVAVTYRFDFNRHWHRRHQQ
jgi:opacity protein-like surface antigen